MSDTGEASTHAEEDAAPDVTNWFTPGWANAVWMIVCGTISGVILSAGEARRTGDPELVGMIAGAVIGTYLVSTLCGWMAWRAARRRRGGGRLVFALFCLSGVVVQWSQAVPAIGQRVVYEAALKAVTEHRMQLATLLDREPPLAAADLPAALTYLDAQFGRVEPAFREAPFVRIMRGQAAYVARMELSFVVARHEYDLADVTDLSTLERAGDLARRRAACEQYLAAIKTYRTMFAGSVDYVQRLVDEAKPGADIGERVLKVVRRQEAAKRPALERALAAYELLASADLALFNFLERTRARWHLGSDHRIEYGTPAEVAELERHYDEMDAARDALADIEDKKQPPR